MRALGLAWTLAAVLALPAAALAQTPASPIAAENAQPGTDRWDLPQPADPVIEGYASEASVAPGDSFHLHVRAPAGDSYRILVYRLGW